MTEQEKRRLFPTQDVNRYLENRLGTDWREGLTAWEIIDLMNAARNDMAASLERQAQRV
jgi:hypothetical protein